MDEPDGGKGAPPPSSDDPAAGVPEVLPAAEADPHVQALLHAPQNAADIVAQQSAPSTHHGGPGQTDVTYGSGPHTGSVRWPGAANPLTGQRALGDAATPAGDDGAKGGVTGKPGARTPQASTPGSNGPILKKPGQGTAGDPSSLSGALMRRGMQMGLRKAGEGADTALRAYSNRYAPGLYDKVKGSDLGGEGLDKLEGSKLGKVLPAAFWDGFRGAQAKRAASEKQGTKDGGNGKENPSGQSDDSASRRRKFKVLMAVTLPVLVPGLVILMLLSLLLGVSATDDKHTQPPDDSDAKVAKYFPGGWQKLLKDAAQDAEASGTADYATVPWTVLAGIVAAQTEFARYSPYDSDDRDPGRKASGLPIGGDGGGGGGDAVVVGDTGGAGPGPISGVTGSGSTARVGNGHPGPPPGDLSHQLGWFMYSLRMHESNGDYTIGNSEGACGAYQYINSTWDNYGGYPTACKAPPSVQDRKAVHDVLKKWNVYHTWQQVAAAHFYPSWARSPEKWGQCPAACHVNPPVWDYIDDIMKRMKEAAKQHPQGGGGAAQPASFRTGAGTTSGAMSGTTAMSGVGGTSGALGPGTYADGCPVANPSPRIGGKGKQGSGPYLLTPAAAGQMAMTGLDPQNPCDSSAFVARQLAEAAKKVHDEPDAPEWKPDGVLKDQENARKYWSRVIEASGIFVDRTADPDAPCAVPPPDDPKKPWSTSFKIISIWRCETTRMPELYLVTSAKYDEKNRVRYTVEPDRAAATETLVNEALSVSYGAGKWKTDKCENVKGGRQGVFPMTKKEAEAAGVKDRCDVDANIAGAARLVLSVEKVKPEKRPHDRGPFQPMAGGWQKLSIAMGTDLDLFSLVGPGQGFAPKESCTKVMTAFLTAIAPHATAFAKLTAPPKADKVFSEWEPKLEKAEKAGRVTDPGDDPACQAGSWSPGFSAVLAQLAAGLADGSAYAGELDGLGNYYQGREGALAPTASVPGQDTLVVPRLALRPLKEIGAPIEPDATEAWSRLGTSDGVAIPLSQLAVEYAWFFGGVISPFDSAGRLIGSLANGSTADGAPGTVQVSVGPDGCPTNAPGNTLRDGAKKIGIHKLCADSVAKARTPQAAKAIKWALTHLGWPYSQARRNENGYADCSSFVTRAYRDSGAIPNLYPKGSNAPTTITLVSVRWVHRISLGQAQPGDLVEPIPNSEDTGHVAMRLADGYKVHTNRTGDVSHVERDYTSAYWVGWVDPSLA
ncbi:transglycosylase family protein [Actinomadura violacea]|uniref:Transglycosylase family protein n=1 Tax=Actinomadura violacea TaxID=2819934 RepID=A0ABS3S8K1_9ACTN|nr:transglycosylase family protein [Actinomadura violacea]MBO2465322.1 transglycosylase family protein [Actinomadura violacea]